MTITEIYSRLTLENKFRAAQFLISTLTREQSKSVLDFMKRTLESQIKEENKKRREHK